MPTRLCGFSFSSGSFAALCASLILLPTAAANAQTTKKDGIADLIGTAQQPAVPLGRQACGRARRAGRSARGRCRLRAGAPAHGGHRRHFQRCLGAARGSKKLPGKDEFLVTPLWTETKEDRETKVRALLDSALAIVTDVPVVEVQKKIEGYRRNIRDLEERIVTLKEKQLCAPKDGVLPGMIDGHGCEPRRRHRGLAKRRIEENRANIVRAPRARSRRRSPRAGLGLEADQLDLLVDSVLSERPRAPRGDVPCRQGHRRASRQAHERRARRIRARRASTLPCMRRCSPSSCTRRTRRLRKSTRSTCWKLDAILKDIAAAKTRTANLLRADNRPDQQRALEANRDSQKLAEDAARGYRRYLTQQREQIAQARSRAAHDLRIADNTFETVEASLELRNLMRDSSASFEAIQKLEAPTFEQIFKNEELRREFENLTRKLDAPTS